MSEATRREKAAAAATVEEVTRRERAAAAAAVEGATRRERTAAAIAVSEATRRERASVAETATSVALDTERARAATLEVRWAMWGLWSFPLLIVILPSPAQAELDALRILLSEPYAASESDAWAREVAGGRDTGALLAAAKAGDVAALQAALDDGGSTEEADEVRGLRGGRWGARGVPPLQATRDSCLRCAWGVPPLHAVMSDSPPPLSPASLLAAEWLDSTLLGCFQRPPRGTPHSSGGWRQSGRNYKGACQNLALLPPQLVYPPLPLQADYTPLHGAAADGHAPIVALLLATPGVPPLARTQVRTGKRGGGGGVSLKNREAHGICASRNCRCCCYCRRAGPHWTWRGGAATPPLPQCSRPTPGWPLPRPLAEWAATARTYSPACTPILGSCAQCAWGRQTPC